MLSSSSGCEAAEYKIRDHCWCFSNWVFLSCVHDSFARVCGISPCDVSIRCVPTSCPPACALRRVQGRGTAPSLALQQPSQGWGTNPANTRTPLPEYQNSCYVCHPKKFQVPPWQGCQCSLSPPVWHLGTPMELFPLISPNFACRTLLLIVFWEEAQQGLAFLAAWPLAASSDPARSLPPDSMTKAATAKRIHAKATLTHSWSGLERSALQTCQWITLNRYWNILWTEKKNRFVNITHFPQLLVNNIEFCPAYSLHCYLRITHILKYLRECLTLCPLIAKDCNNSWVVQQPNKPKPHLISSLPKSTQGYVHSQSRAAPLDTLICINTPWVADYNPWTSEGVKVQRLYVFIQCVNCICMCWLHLCVYLMYLFNSMKNVPGDFSVCIHLHQM